MKTIEEIRHDNLLSILAELAKDHGERGAIQRLATAMGRSHSHVSQLKTKAPHSNTKKPRNIGPTMARLIEKAAGKPRGWLDSERGAVEERVSLSEVAQMIRTELDKRGVGASPGAVPGKRTGTSG